VMCGTYNINGNQDAINALGWTTISTSCCAAAGGTSGTYTIPGSLWADDGGPWIRLLLAFKSGEGQNNPSWWAFELPSDNTGGSSNILQYPNPTPHTR